MPFSGEGENCRPFNSKGHSGYLCPTFSACNVGDLGSIPGLGRSTGEGIGYPLQYSWASLVAQLLYLEAQDPDKDIQFYINSPGGSVTAGMAIYDTMQYIKCDVATICVGMAASMGAFLLSAGTKGKRMALPNAEIMIHQPSAGTQGQITDMAIHMKRLQTIKERMNKILAENTGKSVEEVTAACERDNFMTAQEALEFGLVDRVLERH